jgi:hypothetical protein
LSAGKPFINNFLPVTNDTSGGGKLYGGDLLRLNMATPITPRGTTEYANNARMGLIRAAAIGLTDTSFNGSTALQSIPHMDGFPNGRRLEDDVTTIELQAVGGLVLAAVGLPFNDAHAPDYSDLASKDLVAHLTYNAGPTQNDVPFMTTFPYLAPPHRGYDYVKKLTADPPSGTTGVEQDFLGMNVPKSFILDQNFPNPFNPTTQIRYHISDAAQVALKVYNNLGQEVATLVQSHQAPGTYTTHWNAQNAASGVYYYTLSVGERVVQSKRAVLVK